MTIDLNVRLTAADAVAEHLRKEILRGDHAPGARLRQTEIAKRFGVSTTPAREALGLLQARGLVDIDPYRGAVVFRPTVKDLSNSYEIRQVLETYAVARAMPNLTADHFDELASVAAEMRTTTDVDKWMRLNDAFHLIIYSAADNPRLTNAIAQQHASSSMYIYMHMTHTGEREVMNDQHDSILAACRRGNVEEAQEMIRRHLESSITAMLRMLEEAEAAEPPSGNTSGPMAITAR